MAFLSLSLNSLRRRAAAAAAGAPAAECGDACVEDGACAPSESFDCGGAETCVCAVAGSAAAGSLAAMTGVITLPLGACSSLRVIVPLDADIGGFPVPGV